MENEKDGQWKPFLSTKEGIERSIKEWREMPYDNSKAGQVFVTINAGKLPEVIHSEKEHEGLKERRDEYYEREFNFSETFIPQINQEMSLF